MADTLSDADPAAALTAALGRLGGRAGNIALRRALGWDRALYQRVRAGLLASGALVPFRAHGGGIALGGCIEFGNVLHERALYEPVADVLRNAWAAAHGFAGAEVLVGVTAAQGGRATGGQWTRPDLVLAALRTYPYVPGRFLDVVTFEIKPARTLDVQAVFEALSHRRCATQSYVWVHAPEIAAPVAREAARHGIGVIAANAPTDAATWRTVVPAQRTDANPHDINEFLSLQLSASAREHLARWLR